MQALIEQARSFSSRGGDLSHLAGGQSPEVLFVCCSDSRVVPALMTGARPGELFELRTAGGVVPPYRDDWPWGEAAVTIEYAVEVLGVCEVVVCVHSECGAVSGPPAGERVESSPAPQDGPVIEPGLPAPPGGPGEPEPQMSLAEREHMLIQLESLRSYPCVQARLADGRLRVHGWFYEVHTGFVSTRWCGGGVDWDGGEFVRW
ncbi:carbonic anhydrase [Streptomyces sp. NPDC051776]|uniref:carbonic anhydrase n=1 Tax=Streptomyces sp. NPDC051776 TaxID=3155414 RepID=UPI00341CE1ED